MGRTRTISEHERLRRRAGYSVTGLAQALGFTHSYVSQVEAGLDPSARYRRAFAEHIGVAEALVFNDRDTPRA